MIYILGFFKLIIELTGLDWVDMIFLWAYTIESIWYFYVFYDTFMGFNRFTVFLKRHSDWVGEQFVYLDFYRDTRINLNFVLYRVVKWVGPIQ